MRIVAVFMAAGLASIARLYAQLPHPVSLEEVGVGSVPGVQFQGTDYYNWSGYDVCAAGDVNADGLADVLIGAPHAGTDPPCCSGKAHLVFGSVSMAGSIVLGSLSGNGGVSFDGIDPSDSTGLSVSSAGDVNGDGFADLLIGAPGDVLNPPTGVTGRAFLVYGSASGTGGGGALDLSTLDGTNGVRLNGIGDEDRSGFSVSGAGDVNGDGFADLLVGAYNVGNSAPGNTDGHGETYLIYGSSAGIGVGGTLDLSSLTGSDGVRLVGRGHCGISVSGAGDVNGDGFADLLTGAEAENYYTGQTYLVFGSASGIGSGGVLDLATLNGTDGIRLDGIDQYDYSGYSVSGAGDVNGDGLDDLLIGAWGANSGAGETYLVFGSASGIGSGGVLDLATLNGTNGVRLDGIDPEDYSGRSVSGAGDVNGDGYGDLVIGAIGGNWGSWDLHGESYLLYGPITGLGPSGEFDLSTLDGNSGILLNRFSAVNGGGWECGNSVSGAGDFSGDGFPDLLIAAGIGGYMGSGQTYLVFGSGATPPGHRAFTAAGDPPRTGIGAIDGSGNIPTSRVWVDYDAGNLASTEAMFTRLVTTSFAPLVVSPEYEWEISAARTGYGSAEVTFKGFGVAGETDWQALILTTDDGGASWYAPASQTRRSLVHEIALPGQVFPGRYALVSASDTATPEVIDAVLTDANDNGVADAGEVLTLIFDRGVIVRPAQLSQASFSLPVSGDSLGGAGFAVAGNAENSRFVDITLGASPTLTIPGAFGLTTPGSPSGIDIASGLLPTAIQSLVGRPAAPSAPTDIDFTLKTKSTLIPTSGGTATVTSSTDAAYTGHALVIPSGALSSPTTFTLQPPPNSGGQINAVQIVSSPEGVTFSTPATLTLEYRDSDIDTERGQREASMRIHQLVENPIGTFAFQTVPGTQDVNTGANTVSVDIDDLNPAGSAGEVGIFAILPGETIERALFHIRPEATGAPVRMASDPGSVVLQVGTHGLYTEHWIEIPGYEFTSPTDPARTTVRLSSPTLFDRVSTVGGQSFPTVSGSLLVVETWNAAGQPIAFTDPVTVRVEFRDDDLVDFGGDPGGVTNMRLVRDTIDGPMVHFAFIPDDGHALGTLPGGGWTERSGITDLTGPSGRGVWGAVANLAVPVELSVFTQE